MRERGSTVAGPAPVSGARTRFVEPPRPIVVVTLALAGCAAAATSVWLAFASDHVDEPGINAALMVWMVLGYVIAGLVAWWRRPGPFGPLMVAAGFGIFLSSLSWSNVPVLFTIGIMFDLVAAVLFLHVFLAFPSGRLGALRARARRHRILHGVRACRSSGWLLDGFGPDNVIAIGSDSDAASIFCTSSSSC